MKFIVTVNLGRVYERENQHNPAKKLSGLCPTYYGKICTDATGAHHSVLVEAESFKEASTLPQFLGVHITRIEEV